ncbi:MAG: DUF927 domain-containing protein [Aquincola sp.]|nr:DUF927 domain-containing protein [Aquincola sp.]
MPAGNIVLAKRIQKPKPEGGSFWTFSHRCVKLFSDAATAVDEFVGDGFDAYYAMASYKQGFHKNEKGKSVIRVRENVALLKALWFDVDFKGAYPDVVTAVGALQAFCKAVGLPAPSLLVHSGNGIHVYWPLSEAVSLDRWQRLADALKQAAKEHELGADLACTADACRVLRPPGSTNFKDPANPKPVKLLYSSDKTFDYEHLEATLVPFMQARKPVLTGIAASAISELTGGVEPRQSAPSRFDEIIKHCAVAKHHAETHGADATEPEWMSLLQILKHCEDGQLWVHGVSDGHPGYNEADTQRKWEARLANAAGPTLCRTFDGYRPALCKKCPHYGFVKTPLQVGVETSEPVDGLPSGWRTAENKRGVERLMIIDQGEGKTTKEWMRVMRYTPSSLRVTRSIVTGRYDLQFEIEIKDSRPWSVHLPGASLGNPRKLSEQLADCGLVFKEKELKSFLDLMSTWLEKLQAARRIADVTESLGWLISDEGVDQRIIGFSCGSTTFYADGRVRNDVRAARDFREVAKLYEPRGALEPWKQGAQFIAEQNNPAFTAILAASFGAPLLRFTGQSGGDLINRFYCQRCGQVVRVEDLTGRVGIEGRDQFSR